MKFEMFIKEGNGYSKIEVSPPNGSGWHYLQTLKLNVLKELEYIREDIVKIFGKGDINSLSRPVIEDREKQKVLDKLIDIRKINNKIKDEIITLLSETEFISCYCGDKMIKTPIGVRFERFGNNYIIKDEVNHSIKYSYMCVGCYRARSIEDYEYEQRNIKIRTELLKDGESFVPNNQGFWSWWNKNKSTKPKELQEEKSDCDHAWLREFEYINIGGIIQGKKSMFVKITEVCKKCGKKVNIK